MHDITRELQNVDAADAEASARLLSLLYDELRRLAAARLASEPAGQTLQATALVHEAYLRLLPRGAASNGKDARDVGLSVSSEPSSAVEASLDLPAWNSRGHFFAAAAEAMRRILVENARRKNRLKHGGGMERVEVDLDHVDIEAPADVREDLIALDAALDRLAEVEPDAARLVQLRYFAGLSIPAIAETLGMSPRSADRLWAYARAWLHRELRTDRDDA